MQPELFVKMVLLAWDGQNKNFIKVLDNLPDEKLLREVAPGKNTGIYLLGHMVAVHDAMLPLLGYGDLLFPELAPIFISNPDKSGLPKPPVAELRLQLNQVITVLTKHIDATSTTEWFERHTSVKPEDFEKEPHRNRLNVMITRTHHLAYHLGQIALLK